MTKPYQQWIQFLYGPIFKVIGFFYRSYKTNRDWIENLKSGEKASSFIKNAAIIILLVWILIWYFAPEGSGHSLTEAVKGTVDGLESLSD